MLALLALASCAGRHAQGPDVIGGRGLPRADASAHPGFLLGLNESVAVPRAHVREGRYAEPTVLRAALDADAAASATIGAVLVRGHTGGFPAASWTTWEHGGRDETDAWIAAVQAAGIVPLGMLGPWPGNHTERHTDAYVPADLPAYAAYVRAVVERYDGDGVDDMPGLRAPVGAWELDNEPDLKARAGLCAPAEYAAVLRVTSEAVRAAAPGVRLLAPGLYAAHGPGGRAYLDALAAEPGAADAIDVLSVHAYADDLGQQAGQAVRAAREAFPGKPVWVTEAGRSARGGEDAQARALLGLIAHVSAAGGEALLWHTLHDPPRRARTAVPAHGLFRRAGAGEQPRAAALAYARLAALLRAHDARGAVPDGPGAHRIPDGAVLLWEGERPVPQGALELVTGGEVPPGGIARAPAFLYAG